MNMAPIKPPTFIHCNVRIILQQGNMIPFFTQGVYFKTLSCMYSNIKLLPTRPHRYNTTITGSLSLVPLCIFCIVWFDCKLQLKPTNCYR